MSRTWFAAGIEELEMMTGPSSVPTVASLIMVTALVVQDATASVELAAAGAPAFCCVIPTRT